MMLVKTIYIQPVSFEMNFNTLGQFFLAPACIARLSLDESIMGRGFENGCFVNLRK